MDNIKIRCKYCNTELEGNPARTVTCGCSNMTTIHNNNKITAIDLTQIVMLTVPDAKTKTSSFSSADIAWHEARHKRKVKKLDFEIR